MAPAAAAAPASASPGASWDADAASADGDARDSCPVFASIVGTAVAAASTPEVFVAAAS